MSVRQDVLRSEKLKYKKEVSVRILKKNQCTGLLRWILLRVFLSKVSLVFNNKKSELLLLRFYCTKKAAIKTAFKIYARRFHKTSKLRLKSLARKALQFCGASQLAYAQNSRAQIQLVSFLAASAKIESLRGKIIRFFNGLVAVQRVIKQQQSVMLVRI